MKKLFKYILIIIILIIAFILDAIILDTINAKAFKKSPIISKHKVLDNYNYVDQGILFNVFYCHHSNDVLVVSWKLKFNNYECPTINNKNMLEITNHVFIRTYNIEKIENIDKDNIYLTITNNNNNKKKVKIQKIKNIEIGKKYQFIFQIKSNQIEDNIESIFKNTTILSITETNKNSNQFIR